MVPLLHFADVATGSSILLLLKVRILLLISEQHSSYFSNSRISGSRHYSRGRGKRRSTSKNGGIFKAPSSTQINNLQHLYWYQ